MVCLLASAGLLWGCPQAREPDRPADEEPEEATPGELELRPETVDAPHEDVPRPSVPAGDAERPGVSERRSAPEPEPEPGGPGAQPPAGPSRAIERGRYLAERVAQCIVCHTPKDDAGDLILERRFQGAPIPVESPYPGRTWAVEAPAIAGLSFYTREEAVRLLTEGIARDGEPPRPPMPRFGMTREDAEAVFEFLRSLR
ncbi:MAG: c-type cytochrome [Thermoanaerobaculia bacterium]